MTTTNLANGPAKAAPGRLTLRLAALLLAHEGSLPQATAIAFAESVRAGTKSAYRMLDDGMRPLAQAGVAVRHQGIWYAPVLAELAGWLADGLEYREDAGMAVDPVLPTGARTPAAIPVQAGRASVAV